MIKFIKKMLEKRRIKKIVKELNKPRKYIY
jgi:hypothetical protein